ncbi:galactose oxidase [Alternaria panax]|uniref:Galactose oxidase n=1 Tax=Alternaria panax TaxID=48097 RepID=A0AAD4IK45_9PLEO|nr:galactose oxidase [Alternaria panax]
MNWYDTIGAGSTTGAGNRLDDGHAMSGNAVMFDAKAGKILTAGGAADYENSDGRTNAYIVTLGAPKTTPTVTKIQSMAYARGFANGVVLPNGKVFVTGGQSRLQPFKDDTAQLTPELWDPTTGKWTQLNPIQVPRTYHSVEILLPDTTIFNGGVPESNHFDAEIFVPPYLLNTDGTRRTRPVISVVASSGRLGATLSITTAGTITKFSLVRSGTATHTVNMDQRRISLASTEGGTAYTTTIPSDPGVALPGYWLLFAIDSSGTPNVGKAIKLVV